MTQSPPGIIKPGLQSLEQARERMTFLYIERCVVSRQDGAISVTDARGTVCVPAAGLSVLMLGPGTKLTHRAMELIGDAGTCTVWTGEQGVRYYAHGRPLTHSARLLLRQAELVSNMRTRLAVARSMYQLRFPDEDVSDLTMQQLRGREGARVRSVYRRMSHDTGVPWHGREYDPDDYDGGSEINKALSAAHSCLYGLAHSVIVAMGCSPGLGFVHTGHERSFVYDIADLYKADTTIPVSFRMAAESPPDIGAAVRRAMRDAFRESDILARMVNDLKRLLANGEQEEGVDVNVLRLWDDKCGTVENARSYGTDEYEPDEEYRDTGYGSIIGDV